MAKRFNVRVYGILINDLNQVLLADELIKGNYVTKFPGGGLELGEGLRDGLIREFLEETGVDITVGEHLFTTDFFVQSAFDPDSQVISVYYFVETMDWRKITAHKNKFAFEVIEGKDAEAFRWVNLDELEKETHIVFSTDQAAVFELLRMRGRE